MNLLNALAEAQGGQGLNNLASQFGLTPQQTQSAVGALIPQIVSGMQGQSGGLGALVGMLSGGAHATVADQAGAAFGDKGVSMGNEVLGQIFGSKEVSRGVANQVSQQTGVGSDVLRQMLPVVATLVMGALAKQGMGAGGAAAAPQGGGLGGLLGGLLGGAASPAGGAQGGVAGMLSSVLDANKDGNVADDLAKLAGGFFKNR
ncbi:MAG: DUF937 domain-containing protein [Pseudomonadota bacterium]